MREINYYGIRENFASEHLFTCKEGEELSKEEEFENNDFVFIVKEKITRVVPDSVIYSYSKFTILDSNFIPLALKCGNIKLNSTISEGYACQGSGSMSKTFFKYKYSTMEELELTSKRKDRAEPKLQQLLREIKMLQKNGLTDNVKEILNDFKTDN